MKMIINVNDVRRIFSNKMEIKLVLKIIKWREVTLNKRLFY